jgi:hypothetical protein
MTPGITPAMAAASTPPATPEPTDTVETLLESLGNIAYRGVLDQPIRLTGGYFEGSPFVEAGASRPTVMLLPEPVALGELDGDGQQDAAVLLAMNSGGSGTYIYLATVELRDGAWTNTATTLLGDRVQLHGLTIEDDQISLTLLSHGPDDPACCPTLATTRRFRWNDEQLVEAVD